MSNLIIIGGGPAGLSAAIYAVRADINTTVLYKDDGALGKTDKIENYFGLPEAITGQELLRRGRAQATRLGVKLIQAEVTGIEFDGTALSVAAEADYPSDAVLLATGAPRAKPPIQNLTALEGHGVSYCAICDAFFYRGKSVAVLGFGDYAIAEAQTLLPVVGSVTLLTGGAAVPAGLPNGVRVDTRPLRAVLGTEAVEGVQFEDGSSLPFDGLFVAYGTAGSADFARKLGAVLDGNTIRVDEHFATNVPGVYAAGDCTGGLLQIAKAVSDGAIAANAMIRFLRGK